MQVLMATQNFIYAWPGGWDPAAFAEAYRRAVALSATCEADLTTLEGWFGVSGGFGPTNRVRIVITLLDYGLGNNGGYQQNGETTINIVPFTGDPNADAAARAVFVAEMAEVMMDYRNQKTRTQTWLADNSMGEALSTVCEGLLHPEGYYPPPINGPRITIWLNSTTSLINWQRPNWIDRTENSDRNYVSFGCGIAFIYYLMWRGYSIQQIIANGGQTFEAVYQNLTKSTGGWGAFASLLDLHFPEFPHPRYAPTSDNLFPLPQLAGVSLQPTTVVAGLPATGTVTLEAAQGETFVTLISGDPGFATVPATVIIPAGNTSVDFPVTSLPKASAFKPASVIIYASYGGATVTATLIVTPSVVAGVLKSITLNPSRVTGGSTSLGTVTLEGKVPIPTVVGLAAVESGAGPIRPHGQASAIVTVPPSVPIPPNETQATFTIRTAEIAEPGVRRTATIVAGAVATKFATLTVESS